LRKTLAYMAQSLTTPSGLFGESWTKLVGGQIIPVQDMPHVWEHALFYMAAVRVDGAHRYTFQHSDFYTRACRSGAAPPSACPRIRRRP
jgi:hypothetical protein